MQIQLLGLLTILVLSGCDADPITELDQPGTDDFADFEAQADVELVERDITTAALATTWGWTPYTSEEDPPIACEGSLVNGYGCSGSYCDNNRMYCSQVNIHGGSSYWTTRFSEEPTNHRYCQERYWVVGLSCSGRYCDNLSLQCRHFPGATPTDCYWTGWLSEEGGGTLYFGAGYYARGVLCSGSYCDNKRFYVCRL